jgi:hypothetical protein
MSSRVRATTDVAKRRREEPTLNPPNVPLELATIETTIEEFTKLVSALFLWQIPNRLSIHLAIVFIRNVQEEVA